MHKTVETHLRINSLTILLILFKELMEEMEFNYSQIQQPIKRQHAIKHHLSLLINVGGKELLVMTEELKWFIKIWLWLTMFKDLDSVWGIHNGLRKLSKFLMITIYMVKVKFLIVQIKIQMTIATKLTNRVFIQDKLHLTNKKLCNVKYHIFQWTWTILILLMLMPE